MAMDTNLNNEGEEFKTGPAEEGTSGMGRANGEGKGV
jgi:hypothetical protein